MIRNFEIWKGSAFKRSFWAELALNAKKTEPLLGSDGYNDRKSRHRRKGIKIVKMIMMTTEKKRKTIKTKRMPLILSLR